MKTLMISGSHRPSSQSERVAHYLAERAPQFGLVPDVLSLANNPLPFWDEGVWAGDPKWEPTWGVIRKRIADAQAFVVISPEWSGMVPAGLKNLFLFVTGDLMAHKPALIVGVSSGMGGTYPIAELRTSSYKNTRLVYIPDHVILRKVESMTLKGDPADSLEAHMRDRMDYGLKMLEGYGQALAQMRARGIVDLKRFANGL